MRINTHYVKGQILMLKSTGCIPVTNLNQNKIFNKKSVGSIFAICNLAIDIVWFLYRLAVLELIGSGESDVKSTSDELEDRILKPSLIAGCSVNGILPFYFSSFFPDE